MFEFGKDLIEIKPQRVKARLSSGCCANYCQSHTNIMRPLAIGKPKWLLGVVVKDSYCQ